MMIIIIVTVHVLDLLRYWELDVVQWGSTGDQSVVELKVWTRIDVVLEIVHAVVMVLERRYRVWRDKKMEPCRNIARLLHGWFSEV